MKGLELARKYYEAYGAPMIREEFPEYEEMIAVGLTGSGSECYGYDDDISGDHDFEPGFCIFIPGEEIVDRRTAFLLERAYAKLPAEFEGYKRQKMGPAGGQRHGVFRIDEFFGRQIGCLPEDMTTEKWLSVPEYALAEAVNGEMFRDDLGLVEDQRAILGNMPEDVRKKRLAGHLLMMAQSGQYNYTRCLKHGEPGAAMLAAGEFVKHAMAAVFLLNRRYMPYYKWSFRALRELPDGDVFADALEWILCAGGPETAEEKYYRIEDIAARVIDMLQGQDLTRAVCGDLEKHAYSVNDGITDGDIRNMNILACV